MEMSLFDFGDESVKEFLNTQKAEKEKKKLEKKLEDTGLKSKRTTISNNSSKIRYWKSNTKVSKQVVPNADILKKCKSCEKIVLKVYGMTNIRDYK